MSSSKARKSSRTEAPAAAAAGLPEVLIGRLQGIGPEGTPLVDFPGNPESVPLAALSSSAIGPDSIGQEVALLFVGGDPRRPFVVGLLREPEPIAHEVALPAETSGTPIVKVDGERIEFTAQREIVLTCGRASITLTRAGKILIRGAYLSSRSSGVNRIKGGSVQIN